MKKLIVKPGREKSLLQRHPWLFSGAIAKIAGKPESGETVAIHSTDGVLLAYAAYSPASQIRARVWTWREDEVIDRAFFHRRLSIAIKARDSLTACTNALRLVHAEADDLPGLIVDRYHDVLVIQILAAGTEYWRATLIDVLAELLPGMSIYERSDVEVRALEGLNERKGWALGERALPLLIEEHGLRYRVDIAQGQKTGFYLDQRENRRYLGKVARGAEVLNCFCYSGGFSLAALAGGAKHVLSIDSSAEALALAKRNVAENNLSSDSAEWLEGDVFSELRRLAQAKRTFDLIVLDPPKFAPTAKHIEKAARAYKDINLWAFKLLRPGGGLATFSCSGSLSADLLQKIVAGAAVDAEVEAKIIGRLTADDDHPVRLSFPEGDYLKGLFLRRL